MSDLLEYMLFPVGTIQPTLYAFLVPCTNKNFHFFCTPAATHLAYTQIIDLTNKGDSIQYVITGLRLQTGFKLPMEVKWLEAN